MIVKILGAIDLMSAFLFLMLVFGLSPLTPLILFSAGLLLVKGGFILTGDVLSLIDIISSITLILTLFFTLPLVILWFPGLLLLAKGFMSFF